MLTAGLAVASLIATQVHPIFWLIGALLALASLAVWLGVARNDVAGLDIDAEAMMWHSTGVAAGAKRVLLTDIATINLRNITDADTLLIETHSGDVLACSDLHFQDGLAVFDAIRDLKPGIKLLLNDSPLDG